MLKLVRNNNVKESLIRESSTGKQGKEVDVTEFRRMIKPNLERQTQFGSEHAQQSIATQYIGPEQSIQDTLVPLFFAHFCCLKKVRHFKTFFLT